MSVPLLPHLAVELALSAFGKKILWGFRSKEAL
jgi:hypothetical protein